MREKMSGDMEMSGDEGSSAPLLPSIATYPIIPILLVVGPGLVYQSYFHGRHRGYRGAENSALRAPNSGLCVSVVNPVLAPARAT
jgi:hypothetical protein